MTDLRADTEYPSLSESRYGIRPARWRDTMEDFGVVTLDGEPLPATRRWEDDLAIISKEARRHIEEERGHGFRWRQFSRRSRLGRVWMALTMPREWHP